MVLLLVIMAALDGKDTEIDGDQVAASSQIELTVTNTEGNVVVRSIASEQMPPTVELREGRQIIGEYSGRPRHVQPRAVDVVHLPHGHGGQLCPEAEAVKVEQPLGVL